MNFLLWQVCCFQMSVFFSTYLRRWYLYKLVELNFGNAVVYIKNTSSLSHCHFGFTFRLIDKRKTWTSASQDFLIQAFKHSLKKFSLSCKGLKIDDLSARCNNISVSFICFTSLGNANPPHKVPETFWENSLAVLLWKADLSPKRVLLANKHTSVISQQLQPWCEPVKFPSDTFQVPCGTFVSAADRNGLTVGCCPPVSLT